VRVERRPPYVSTGEYFFDGDRIEGLVMHQRRDCTPQRSLRAFNAAIVDGQASHV
jgi:hypothetical protein